MVFENKNSHWIDAYTRKFEESFKSINLLDKKRNTGDLLLLQFGTINYLLKSFKKQDHHNH